MQLKKRVAAVLMIATAVAISGCDVFQIPHTVPGPESGLIKEDAGYSTALADTGTGVGSKSVEGPAIKHSGSSTQILGTGASGVISSPGPNRQGR